MTGHAMNGALQDTGKLEIRIVPGDGDTVVFLSGPIDIDSSPVVRGRLLTVLQSPNGKIVSVDMAGVTQIDSSGLATLIEALKIARGNKNELRLQGLQHGLLKLFESTCILWLFDGSDRNASQCEAQ